MLYSIWRCTLFFQHINFSNDLKPYLLYMFGIIWIRKLVRIIFENGFSKKYSKCKIIKFSKDLILLSIFHSWSSCWWQNLYNLFNYITLFSLIKRHYIWPLMTMIITQSHPSYCGSKCTQGSLLCLFLSQSDRGLNTLIQKSLCVIILYLDMKL